MKDVVLQKQIVNSLLNSNSNSLLGYLKVKEFLLCGMWAIRKPRQPVQVPATFTGIKWLR